MPFDPIGVVLAGGAGRRLGGAKASVSLGERPLAAWVADALGAVLDEVVLVGRVDTVLPDVGIPVWREPVSERPPHPLAGLAVALRRAGGRPVLACPVDLPFVPEATLSALLGAPGAVAVADGQPLLGRFDATCAPALAAAAAAQAPVRVTVAGLSPTVVAVPEPASLFNVNTAADLEIARARAGAGAPPRHR